MLVAPNEACSFMYQITVALPDGREIDQTISDDGQPFRVSSPSSLYSSTQYHSGKPRFSRFKTVFVGGVADVAPVGATSSAWLVSCGDGLGLR